MEDYEDDKLNALSVVEVSDNKDLISLDGDVPGSDLTGYDGSDAGEGEEWGGIAEGTVDDQMRKSEETREQKEEAEYCNAIISICCCRQGKPSESW